MTKNMINMIKYKKMTIKNTRNGKGNYQMIRNMTKNMTKNDKKMHNMMNNNDKENAQE